MGRRKERYMFIGEHVKARLYELQGDDDNPPRHIICSRSEYDAIPEEDQASFLSEKLFRKLEELRKKKKERSKELTFHEAKEKYFKYLKSLNAKKSTFETYNVSLNYYKQLHGNHPISDFTRARVNSLVELLGQNHAANTVNKHVRHLRAFCQYLYDEEIIENKFKIRSVKAVKKVPVTYSPEQFDELEKLIRHHIERPYNKRQLMYRINHLRAFHLLICTLFRRGEIQHLPLHHINLREKSIFLGEVKTETIDWSQKNNEEHFLPIVSRFQWFLEEDLPRSPEQKWYLDDGTGNPCYADPRQWSRVFGGYFDQLGYKKSWPVHVFRQSGATYLAKHGTPLKVIQRILRHASSTTTERYINEFELEIQTAMERL